MNCELLAGVCSMTRADFRKSGKEGTSTLYIGFLAIGLVVGVMLGLALSASVIPITQTHSFRSTNVLPPEEAGEKAVDFIATYAVLPGIEVTLINVTEVETDNLYKIATNLSVLGISETQEIYMTTDGELLFPGAIDIDEFKAQMESQKEQGEFRNQT